MIFPYCPNDPSQFFSPLDSMASYKRPQDPAARVGESRTSAQGCTKSRLQQATLNRKLDSDWHLLAQNLGETHGTDRCFGPLSLKFPHIPWPEILYPWRSQNIFENIVHGQFVLPMAFPQKHQRTLRPGQWNMDCGEKSKARRRAQVSLSQKNDDLQRFHPTWTAKIPPWRLWYPSLFS